MANFTVEVTPNETFIIQSIPAPTTFVVTNTNTTTIVEIARGPQGPIGPPGPPGINGSTGQYSIVTTSGNIPLGQTYTIANPLGNITLTLPSLVSVVSGNLTTQYYVRSLVQAIITIAAFAGDNIEGSPTITLINDHASWGLVATTAGWYIV